MGTERSEIEELSMVVAVIDGTGHVGTYLVPRVVELGHEVILVSRGKREPYQSHAAWGRVKRVSNLVILGMLCWLGGMSGGCMKAPHMGYAEVVNRIPPLEAGYARVYLYSLGPRTYFGSPDYVTPAHSYKLAADGKEVAVLSRSTFAFVDHPAGSIKITAGSPGTRHGGAWPPPPEPKDITFDLTAGQTRYVEADPEPAFPVQQIRLVEVEANAAMHDIRGCHYQGPALPGMAKG
jgi:hypothetical protein